MAGRLNLITRPSNREGLKGRPRGAPGRPDFFELAAASSVLQRLTCVIHSDERKDVPGFTQAVLGLHLRRFPQFFFASQWLTMVYYMTYATVNYLI